MYVMLLWSVVAFRECGFDYEGYKYISNELQANNWYTVGRELGMEPMYSFLNHFVRNYKILVVIMATTTICLQFRFIFKYSHFPFVSLLIYLGAFFYSSLMGQYRQAMGIALVCWAIVNYENKKKFLCLIFLAASFHISSLLALIFFLIPHEIKPLKIYILLFFCSIIISMSAKYVYLNFISNLPVFVANKLEYYLTRDTFEVGLNTAVLLRAIGFGICYYYRKQLETIRDNTFFLNIYFTSLLIYIAFGFMPNMALRGSYYFYIIETVLIANLIYIIKQPAKILVWLFFTGISIYRQVSFFQEWSADYIPYTNWLLN